MVMDIELTQVLNIWGSVPGCVKQKTITFKFGASPISTQRLND